MTDILKELEIQTLKVAAAQIKMDTYKAFDLYRKTGSLGALNDTIRSTPVLNKMFNGKHLRPATTDDILKLAKNNTAVELYKKDPTRFVMSGDKLIDINNLYFSTGYLNRLPKEDLDTMVKSYNVKTPEDDIIRTGSGEVVKKKGYEEYPDGSVKLGGSAAWRNNNPGNMRHSGFTRRHGDLTDEGPFATYPSYSGGKEDLKTLLKHNYMDLTLKDAITKYAPPSENDTKGYVKSLVNSNVSPDTLLRDLSEKDFNALVDGIIKHEGTIRGTVKDPETLNKMSLESKLSRYSELIGKKHPKTGKILVGFDDTEPHNPIWEEEIK